MQKWSTDLQWDICYYASSPKYTDAAAKSDTSRTVDGGELDGFKTAATLDVSRRCSIVAQVRKQLDASTVGPGAGEARGCVCRGHGKPQSSHRVDYVTSTL